MDFLLGDYEETAEMMLWNGCMSKCVSVCVSVRPLEHKQWNGRYLCRRLVSEGIVTLGVTLSRCVCVCRISLGGEGNALYPVLSS